MSDWTLVNGIWRGSADDAPATLVAEVDAELESLPGPALSEVRHGRRNACVYVMRRIADMWNEGDPARDRPLRGWGSDGNHTVKSMDGVWWPSAWKEGRRWRAAVAVAAEYWWDGEWLPRRRLRYTLAHELGHAFSWAPRGPHRHNNAAFRRTYMEERAALSPRQRNHPDLRYFTYHWHAGITEVYAEAFAVAVGAMEDPRFERAFPRCIAHVRTDVDATTGARLAA